MGLYYKFFGDYGKTAAQILLNAEDMENEKNFIVKGENAGTIFTGKATD